MMNPRSTTFLLAYYYDAEARNQLPVDDNGNFSVDFGPEAQINPPKAGRDSIYTSIYVRNEHHYPMGLRPVTIDQDLSITEYPEFLDPQQVGKVTLAFSPSADRIKPLSGGSWDFEKVVYPKS